MSKILDEELYNRIEFFARIRLDDCEKIRFNMEFCSLVDILSKLDDLN